MARNFYEAEWGIRITRVGLTNAGSGTAHPAVSFFAAKYAAGEALTWSGVRWELEGNPAIVAGHHEFPLCSFNVVGCCRR